MKILIPTDITESTLKVLQFLTSFKKAPDIEVDLLYIESNFDQEVISYSRMDRKSAKVDSSHFSPSQHKVLKEITNTYSFVNNVMCRSGNLEKEILKEANSKVYHLLISSTGGIDSFQDIVFGNVTQHLVNDSLIPLISLPEKYMISDSKRLLFVSEFKIDKTSNFQHLLKFIEVFDLELHLLKIVDEGKFDEVAVKSDIISYMNSNKLKYDQIHIRGARTIEEGINHFLEEFDISICAMATHARHGIKHFFFGSQVEQMIDYINVPLYTFRIESK